MSQSILLAFALLAALLLPARAVEDPDHAELRTLRTEVIAAIEKGDIDSVLQHVTPDVVVTWQDSTVCKGRDGLKAFFEKVGKGTFKGYEVPPTPDDLTILSGGDTGISYGSTVAAYHLLGKEYEIRSRWTATLVKQDGKWLLAAYQVSMNVLDNPLLNTAKKALWVAAGAALLLGSAVGWWIGRRKRAVG